MATRNGFKIGSSELLVLHILHSYGDCYGYQILQLLSKNSNGIISFPEGSMYPAFYKMINKGYISDYKMKVGKRLVRVYYHLEPAGKARLRELLDEYTKTIDSINNILTYNFDAEDNTEDE